MTAPQRVTPSIADESRDLSDPLESVESLETPEFSGSGFHPFHWLLGLGSLVALGGLITGGILWFNRAESASISPPITVLPVETILLEPVQSYTVIRTYTGEITARRTSELGFEQSGEVIAINVDEGDQVAAGTPLAILDTRSLDAAKAEMEAQRSQAVAQLAELEAGPRLETIASARATVQDLQKQLDLAETRRRRREELYQEGAISREQLDEIQFETGSLQARLDSAQSQLDELLAGTRQEQIDAQRSVIQQLDASLDRITIDIRKSTIVAPFAGQIGARYVDEGTVIGAGQAVLRLVETGILEARIGVPVDVAPMMQPGTTQTLWIDDQSYPAQVTSILPELDGSTRTVTVLLTLQARAGLTSGQTVRLEVPTSIEIASETSPDQGSISDGSSLDGSSLDGSNFAGSDADPGSSPSTQAAYWLPTTALVPGTRGLWSAYTLQPIDPQTTEDLELETSDPIFTVEQEQVEILHTQGERVLVRGTVMVGDQVIVSGIQRVVPGQWVTLP